MPISHCLVFHRLYREINTTYFLHAPVLYFSSFIFMAWGKIKLWRQLKPKDRLRVGPFVTLVEKGLNKWQVIKLLHFRDWKVRILESNILHIWDLFNMCISKRKINWKYHSISNHFYKQSLWWNFCPLRKVYLTKNTFEIDILDIMHHMSNTRTINYALCRTRSKYSTSIRLKFLELASFSLQEAIIVKPHKERKKVMKLKSIKTFL